MAEGKGKLRPGRLGAELVVVFVGVWMSLGAENWRQSRVEQAGERESLARIVRDLDSEIRDITGNLDRVDVSLGAADRIEAAVARGDVPADSLGEFLTLFQQCSHFIENASEYTTLLSAGRINSVSDADLRQSIVSYYQGHPFMSWAHERDCEGVQRTLDVVGPHVTLTSSSAPFPDILPQVTVASSPQALLRDPDVSLQLVRARYDKRLLHRVVSGQLERARQLRSGILAELR